MLKCTSLLEYVPKQGKVKHLPDTVCKICLSTSPDPKKQQPNGHTTRCKFVCDQSGLNHIICKFSVHKPLQQLLLQSYDPKLGHKNLHVFRQNPKQNTKTKTETNSLTCRAMIANTTINGAEIGCTSCMSETITVKDKYSNPIKIQIHYDSGSQHSLASRLIHKVVLSKRTSNNPIVLSTVSGESKEIKQLSLIKLTNKHQIEVICVPTMDINSFNMKVPKPGKRSQENRHNQQ